ncbi:hypothetical protein H3Z74_06685 [Sphingomonas alpina]|uniref:Uncharacterized protein n=1 Tax=Sphingomonas alpina TaxID=653931 RepID=A0A7H0LMG2_9SPHN|nr:hypothetical protein H3Z74_06685 [Sphingomonas alpina]
MNVVARGRVDAENHNPIGIWPISICCIAASIAWPLPLIFLHPLLNAIHPAIELIQALAIILCLPGCGLCLRQCRLRCAIGFLQSCLECINALAYRSDLIPHIPFGSASTQAQRTNQNDSRRSNFR